jgi:N-formylglutamate amidohydrolase
MLGDSLFDHQARQARQGWLFDEGDPYTDVLFHAPQAHNLHATVSRFVVDLNRPRQQGGNNGVIKLTDFEERPLYPAGFVLSEADREERLRRYWDAFHNEIEASLKAHAIKLIINGHSMQPRGPIIGPDKGQPRPAITLMCAADEQGNKLPGNSHQSLSQAQAKALMELLGKHFTDIVESTDTVPHDIALSRPWTTDELSYRYSDPKRECPVPGFGLEFNKALYLIYQDGQELPNEPMIRGLNEAFQKFLSEAVQLM